MNTKGQGLKEEKQPVHQRGKNYLFTIAIDQYEFSPSLFNCVRDAQRIKTILHRDYQFEPEHTFTLYNEAATEKNIFDTFKKLVRIVRPEDNLLILYSGHGEFETDIEEGYWIPVDAQLGDFSDYVSNSRIVKYLKAINAHHILLIVDSCFSGSLFSHRNAGRAAAALRLDEIPSRWLITAGRNEVVSDGQPGDHSPFADNIIYFLENNKEQSLSVADLSDAVVDAVIYNSRQTPRGEPLQDVGHRGGQFFFHRKGVPPNYRTPEPFRKEPVVQDTPATDLSKTEVSPASGSSFRLLGLFLALILIAAIAGMFLFKPLSQQEITPAGSPDLSGEEALTESSMDSIVSESTKDEATSVPTPPTEDKTPPTPTVNRVEQAWNSAQQTNTETAYRRFIDRFPRSKWVEEAQQKIAEKHRYSLLFSPVLKNGKQLEIHFSNGKAPYRIRVVKPNDEKIEKNWGSGQPCPIDLGTVTQSESGANVIKIIVTDYNFKQKGHVLPVY